MFSTKLNKKYLIIIGVLALIILPWFVYMLMTNPGSEKLTDTNSPPLPGQNSKNSLMPPTPLPQRQPALEFIKPGATLENEVFDYLGQPAGKKSVDKYIVYSYPLPSTKRENKIYMNNNIVEYVYEEVPVDNALFIQFLNKKSLENPEAILYDDYAGAGFYWQVFPSKGVAFLSNPINGYTIKVLYFKPMDYDSFISSAAKTFNLKTQKEIHKESLSE